MEPNILSIDNLRTNAFKMLENVTVDFDSNGANYIVARNGAGKSSILNAITWSLTGLDLFGNRIDPFMIGGPATTWVKIDTVIDGNPVVVRRIIQMKNKGKTETQTNVSLDFDKELFYSLVNPRYIQNLDPKGIKNVIAKAIRLPVTIMEAGIEAELVNSAASYIGYDSYEKIVAVEEGIKQISADVKKLEEEILKQKGTINGIAIQYQICAENGVDISEEVAEVFEMTRDNAQSIIDVKELEIQKKKESSKLLSAYRTAAYEVLATEFNASLKHVKIKLLENGKEVFIVTWDGKNVRACSNSEQLKAGLELVDALSDATGMSYPCLVDNAEAIINVDINEYPHIKQIIFAIVADENLSTWDGSHLSDIETGKLMPRSREQLIPSVKLLEGWGSTPK